MTDADFWTRAAPKYAKSKISNMEAYEVTLERTRTYLSASSEVLEVGCGTGTTALKLSDASKRYVGTDFAPGMIEIAKAKSTEGLSTVPEFRVAEIKASAFSGERFDTVLAFNLLHLLPDLEGALAEIHTILPKGGLFISKTVAVGAKWYYRPLVKIMQAFGKAPYVSFLTVDEIDAVIAAAGFEIVETGLYPPSGPSRFIVARKV